MSDTKTFKLSSPIKTHKGEVSELELKPPTARSFIKHGEPYRVTKDGMLSFDYTSIVGFVADMSGHDVLVLEDIPGRDMPGLATAVVESLLGASPQNGRE